MRLASPKNSSQFRVNMCAVIIAINAAVFMLRTLLDLANPHLRINDWLGLSADGLRAHHDWQPFTYMFLHGEPGNFPLSIAHIGLNMLTLYFLGRELEPFIGARHFLGIYIAGGLLGGFAQCLLGPANSEIIGASAGVCAILIAFTTLFPRLEITALIFFILPLKMRARTLAIGFVAISIAMIFLPFTKQIAHIAHLGGALAGWLYIKLFLRDSAVDFEMPIPREPSNHHLSQPIRENSARAEIDAILEKITHHGIASLTRHERKLLEFADENPSKETP